jgi:uncharacterized protein
MNESTNKPRPLALITGASAGIGEEYARQMAAAGYDLALTARRRERLDKLAAELSAAHGADCLVIAADLAEANAPAEIMAKIEATGRQVTVLVNNAGYAIGGFLNQTGWEEHGQFLQIMVNAVTELCYRCLPGIREQNTGGIINVASLAGIVPGSSGHTLYAAVKAYMIKLSESLAMENVDRRICIQAICPGFTYSEFHDVVGTRDIVSKMPGYMWMNADEVVAISLRQFGNPKAPVMLVPGRWNRFVAMLTRKLPYRASFALMRKRSGSFRRQD